MINFEKPFEVLWKRGSVRTRYSAISILFRREQVKHPFQIPHATVCLNIDAQPLTLVCSKAWITEQRQNKEALYSWERIWWQSIILMAAGVWWPFNLTGFPWNAVAFFYLQALGTVRKCITWKKNTWNDTASILLVELQGLHDLFVPANFSGFALDDL